MELVLPIGIFIVGIVALLWASDRFVDAAEKIGLSLGISPFIIGVTIVAFGTSLPELATSIAAVLGGEPEIVVSNVIGSNITNIALVLGLSAVAVKSTDLENNLWYNDIPFFFGSAFLMWFFVADRTLSIFEAVLCLGGITLFLSYSLRDNGPRDDDRPRATW
ncbi:MAG: sodium:calcium antiporter, partial [Bacteroidota bacterium]